MRKDERERFKIDAVRTGEKEYDLIIETHCSVPFMSGILSAVILDINKRINRTELLKVKNGFWLLLEETVNDALKEEAEDE